MTLAKENPRRAGPPDYNARAIATVPCPKCGAVIHEPCIGVHGPVKYTHFPRRRAAAKKLGTR